MGLKEEEIVEHFTGIGFLVDFFFLLHEQPWNRMGNLRGWGGPLTEEVRYNEFLLNKKVYCSILILIRLLKENQLQV